MEEVLKPGYPNEEKDNVDVLTHKLVEVNDYFELKKKELITICNEIGDMI